MGHQLGSGRGVGCNGVAYFTGAFASRYQFLIHRQRLFKYDPFVEFGQRLGAAGVAHALTGAGSLWSWRQSAFHSDSNNTPLSPSESLPSSKNSKRTVLSKPSRKLNGGRKVVALRRVDRKRVLEQNFLTRIALTG